MSEINNTLVNDPLTGAIVVPPTFSPLSDAQDLTVKEKFNEEFIYDNYHRLVTSADIFLELRNFIHDLLL